MTIKEHVVSRTIDLSSPDGNVFVLIGMVKRLSAKLDKNSTSITKEMMSADYGNAVHVFNREFGDFFDIILPKNMTIKEVKNSALKASMDSEKIKEIYSK